MRYRGAVQGALLAGVLLTGSLLTIVSADAASDEAPKFDVGRTCRAAADLGGGVDAKLAFQGCMQDENDAKATLQRNWTRYKRENRDTCLAQGLEPIPSYVEILTCIEMYDDAGALNRRKGETPAPTPAR